MPMRVQESEISGRPLLERSSLPEPLHQELLSILDSCLRLQPRPTAAQLVNILRVFEEGPGEGLFTNEVRFLLISRRIIESSCSGQGPTPVFFAARDPGYTPAVSMRAEEGRREFWVRLPAAFGKKSLPGNIASLKAHWRDCTFRKTTPDRGVSEWGRTQHRNVPYPSPRRERKAKKGLEET
jgi:hypothetical protein